MSPRIIGNRVKLNPVWLMLAPFAFGWQCGFVALLVAIPLATLQVGKLADALGGSGIRQWLS
jgi:predicted PurR-regulated permease PerM